MTLTRSHFWCLQNCSVKSYKQIKRRTSVIFPSTWQFPPRITSWTKCFWRVLSDRNSHVSIHAQLSLTTIHLMYTFTTDFIIITTNNHLSIYLFNPTSLVLLHLVSDQSLSVERAKTIRHYVRNLKVIDDQRKLSQLSRNIEPWCTTGGSLR